MVELKEFFYAQYAFYWDIVYYDTFNYNHKTVSVDMVTFNFTETIKHPTPTNIDKWVKLLVSNQTNNTVEMRK